MFNYYEPLKLLNTSPTISASLGQLSFTNHQLPFIAQPAPLPAAAQPPGPSASSFAAPSPLPPHWEDRIGSRASSRPWHRGGCDRRLGMTSGQSQSEELEAVLDDIKRDVICYLEINQKISSKPWFSIKMLPHQLINPGFSWLFSPINHSQWLPYQPLLMAINPLQ